MSGERMPEPDADIREGTELKNALEQTEPVPQSENIESSLFERIDTMNRELFPGLNEGTGRQAYQQATEGITSNMQHCSAEMLQTCGVRWEQVRAGEISREVQNVGVPEEVYEMYENLRNDGLSQQDVEQLAHAAHDGTLESFLLERVEEEQKELTAWLERVRPELEAVDVSVRSYFERAGVAYPARRPYPVVGLGPFGGLLVGSAESNTTRTIGAGGIFFEEAGAIYILPHELGVDPNNNKLESHVKQLLAHERMHSLSALNIPYPQNDAVLQNERIAGFQIGFSTKEKSSTRLYNNLNEAATEYFARRVMEQTGQSVDDGGYSEETESLTMLLRYLSGGKGEGVAEKELLQRYTELSGESSFEAEMEREIGPNGLAICNTLLVRPHLMEKFLSALQTTKSGQNPQPLEIDLNVLEDAHPPINPAVVRDAYPFIKLMTHVKNPQTGELERKPYDVGTSAIIEEGARIVEPPATHESESLHEYLAAHEEMFKMGQTMLVNETPDEYKVRVEGLWQKRKEQLLIERGVEDSHDNASELRPEVAQWLGHPKLEEYARRFKSGESLDTILQGQESVADKAEAIRVLASHMLDVDELPQGDAVPNVSPRAGIETSQEQGSSDGTHRDQSAVAAESRNVLGVDMLPEDYEQFTVKHGETLGNEGTLWYEYKNVAARKLKESGKLEWGKERIYFDIPFADMEGLRDLIFRIAREERIPVAFKYLDAARSHKTDIAPDSTTTRFVANFASLQDAKRLHRALQGTEQYQLFKSDRHLEHGGYNIDGVAHYASGYREKRKAFSDAQATLKRNTDGTFSYINSRGTKVTLSSVEYESWVKQFGATVDPKTAWERT